MNPKKPRNAPREQVDTALRLSRRNDLEGSAQALCSLAADYPEDLEVRFATASVLFRLDRYAEAIPHFEKLLPTQPTNEWVSLGLFHSFLKCARKQEALEELRRFDQAGGESMEYRRLQKDIIRALKGSED